MEKEEASQLPRRSLQKKKYKSRFGKPLKNFRVNPVKVKVPNTEERKGTSTENVPSRNLHSRKLKIRH